MAGEIDWEKPGDLDLGIPSCISHRPLSTYQISFHWNRKNFLWTDIKTPTNVIRSTRRSRPKNSTKSRKSPKQQSVNSRH